MRAHLGTLACLMTLLATVVLGTPLYAGDLVVNQLELAHVVSEPVPVVPVDSTAAAAYAERFRTWASASIDLAAADKRTSARFDRVTYQQSLSQDRPLLLEDASKAAVEVGPGRVWLREGPLYHSLLKDKMVGPQTARSEQELTRLAWEYLVRSGLVESSEDAALSTAQIMSRRVNEDLGEVNQEYDYLAQQDVAFQRLVAGRPVLNSQIIVGVLPDSTEIVKVLIKNWAPLASDFKAATLHRPQLTPDQLEQQLVASLDRSVGADWTTARVRDLTLAWFQTGDALLPAVACIVDVEFADPSRNHTILEALNPLGSTDSFRDASELADRQDNS
jgi:hypothetical protein